MNITELQKRAIEIREKYSELNKKNGHNPWGAKDFAMGFAGDFGELQKIIMAKENMRNIQNVDNKLRHELADCLWSLLVLAQHYDINLEDEFVKTMDELEARIARS